MITGENPSVSSYRSCIRFVKNFIIDHIFTKQKRVPQKKLLQEMSAPEGECLLKLADESTALS